ncbi:cytochrome b5 reductase 4 [Phialemonium atrogriseum]|uniref:Cytochrome b5 reductase 4 n=1 Tax=Phialemonium atrogriseum TaxID=1093897 RepID=A0AAJ0BTW1_9PEZI|nr:[Phialemonium atrogriseum] [Phialemonium atrogriseum]KAK1762967.1 cytochrome b5 reductase 4 [Phialemonium atrogriseum]
MGLLGISLIVASVVLFCLRPPAWLPRFFGAGQQPRLDPPPSQAPQNRDNEKDGAAEASGVRKAEATGKNKTALNDEDGDSTPKASAAERNDPVPTFTLSGLDDDQPSSNAPRPTPIAAPRPTPGLMAPPPRPPTRNHIPARNPYAPPSRPSPLPNRAPGTSTLPLPRSAPSSSLAPPPTHTTKPAKPSRAVVLSPGHSPLDWARLSSHPGADLRGLGPNAPYQRVTPSALRAHNGRRGRDAWTVLGGRVYNVTPYVPFHPGGGPELLRGAGKDGTRLFGEVHPWVNYEGMLASCLVGILVGEEEEAGGGEMEEMD